MTDLIARVRAEIGDPPQPFRTTALGDGQTKWYDLPKQNISVITAAEIVNGASIINLVDASAATAYSSSVAYALGAYVTYNGRTWQCAVANTGHVPGSDGDWTDITATAYSINDGLGQIALAQAVPNNATLIMAGVSWSLFTDTELTTYLTESVNQHCFGRTIKTRMLDFRGFVDYQEVPIGLGNLPPIEMPLVVMLATINVFWTLANDVASDVNVHTAEGTSIDRSAQYSQIMSQISAMTARYQDLCGQLNVGVYRAETMTLRRSSRTTGRLVPIFTEQEYDDHTLPTRQLPPVDKRYEDGSGIPSRFYAGPYGV
jgi:hypothetical protein